MNSVMCVRGAATYSISNEQNLRRKLQPACERCGSNGGSLRTVATAAVSGVFVSFFLSTPTMW